MRFHPENPLLYGDLGAGENSAYYEIPWGAMDLIMPAGSALQDNITAVDKECFDFAYYKQYAPVRVGDSVADIERKRREWCRALVEKVYYEIAKLMTKRSGFVFSDDEIERIAIEIAQNLGAHGVGWTTITSRLVSLLSSARSIDEFLSHKLGVQVSPTFILLYSSRKIGVAPKPALVAAPAPTPVIVPEKEKPEPVPVAVPSDTPPAAMPIKPEVEWLPLIGLVGGTLTMLWVISWFLPKGKRG